MDSKKDKPCKARGHNPPKNLKPGVYTWVCEECNQKKMINVKHR